MSRPDVLLLLLPIILTFWLYGRRIHRYGWQTELSEGEPRRDTIHGQPAARPVAPPQDVPEEASWGSPSLSSGCYYAPVTLDEIDAWEDTYDQWRAREKAARP